MIDEIAKYNRAERSPLSRDLCEVARTILAKRLIKVQNFSFLTAMKQNEIWYLFKTRL